MKTRFQIYRDAKREYRWRAKRGRHIVCDSGEGYKRVVRLDRSLRRFIISIQRNEFEIAED